ncbi:MAG: large conductance mechanosensitive channel protein MscL [Verrucomicrobiaceae bacterium]|nr:large conductance mechanosensitive channel protein MscL [Verrucomicrobiaceae bacterium]
MLNEFKNFILKGNVVDLATGVIIGAAFGGIVTAFTKGIVEPLLALVGGGGTPDLKIALSEAVKLDIGIIIGAVISFLITAAVIFFVIVKPANKLMAMMKKAEAAAPPPPAEDIVLLTQIRDLLKK